MVSHSKCAAVFGDPMLLSTIGEFVPLGPVLKVCRAAYHSSKVFLVRTLYSSRNSQFLEDAAFREKILGFVNGRGGLLCLRIRYRQRKMTPAIREILQQVGGLHLTISTRTGSEWMNLKNIVSLEYSGELPELAFLKFSAKILKLLNFVGVKNLDLRSLSNLHALTSLDLTKVASLTQSAAAARLQGLCSLETLLLKESCIKDLEIFGPLPKLKSLDVSHTKIRDLSILTGSPNLVILDANSTAVADLTPLAGLRKLRELRLMNTKITSCDVLKNVESLRTLEVRYTEFQGTQFLRSMRNLKFVNCFNTREQRVSGISGKRGGKILQLESAYGAMEDYGGFFGSDEYVDYF